MRFVALLIVLLLACQECNSQSEIGNDLVFMSPIVAEARPWLPFQDGLGTNNEFAVDPLIVNHGPIEDRYLMHNGSGEIGNCFMFATEPVYYKPAYLNGGFYSYRTTISPSIYDFKTGLYIYNVGRGVACVKGAPATAGSAQTVPNSLSWFVYINGDRNRGCLDCTDKACVGTVPGICSAFNTYYNPSISTLYISRFPNSRTIRNPVFGLSLAIAKQTDNFRSAEAGYCNDESAWCLESTMVGTFGIPMPAMNTPSLGGISRCSSTWTTPTSTTPRDVLTTSGSMPDWDQEVFVQSMCLNPVRGRPAETDMSPFSKVFGLAPYYEFPMVCLQELGNSYTVKCTSPKFATQIAQVFANKAGSQGNPQGEMIKLMYDPPISADPFRNDFPDSWYTFGHFVYPSLRELKKTFYYVARNWVSPTNFAFNPSFQHVPFPDQVMSFGRLPSTAFVAQVPQLNSDYNSQYLPFQPIDKRSDTLPFFGTCPTAPNGRQCNSADNNENVCVGSAGLCMCDMNWLGVACQIPWPRWPSGARFTSIEVIRNSYPEDRYQVCSTSGALVGDTATYRVFNRVTQDGGVTYQITSTTTSGVPVCRCMPGFIGFPTKRRHVHLLASILHAQFVAANAIKRGSTATCYDDTHWSDEVISSELQTLIKAVNMSSSVACGSGQKYRAMFPYMDYIRVHQCQIFGSEDLTRPPLQVYWNPAAFFYRQTSGDTQYLQRKMVYPFPSFGEKRPNNQSINYLLDGRVGIQCMDYKPGGVPYRTTPIVTSPLYLGRIAAMMNWIVDTDTRFNTTVPYCSLYGGALCRCCPDCNRTNSICADFPPLGLNPNSRLADSQTMCYCNTNFCGTLCNTPICARAANGKVCGFGTCNPRLDSTWLTRCNVAPRAGYFAENCTCDNGYEGIACETPVCPLSNNLICSGASRGTCNHVSRKCDCLPQFGGSACERAACPRNNVTGEECSGVLIPGTSTSVCDTTLDPPQCRCQLTMPGIEVADTTLVLKGWPASSGGASGLGYTNTGIYYNGRWGRACEFFHRDVCIDPSGNWCGVPINSDGTAAGSYEGYAGCYNIDCRTQYGTGAPGMECRPQCHCTTEYTNSNKYCAISNCGPQRCDNWNGNDTGDCELSCSTAFGTSISVLCNVPVLTHPAGGIKLQTTCKCKQFNNTIYVQPPGEEGTGAACNNPANGCYSNSNILCNGNGQCLYNSTTASYGCACNTGFTGANCSIPPVCLTPSGGVCTGPNQRCTTNGANSVPVCACNRTYLRDASRLCTNERCISTGGTVQLDGSCLCPGEAFYEDVPFLPTTNNQQYIGCRVGCPVYPDTGVPCGALEVFTSPSGVNGIRSRCSDLLAGVPVFRNSGSPNPFCQCYFRGIDSAGNINYFINDTAVPGGCKPQCNPAGLCKGAQCAGRGTLNSDNTCRCGPNYMGSFCETIRCNKNPILFDQTTCQCKQWCLTGDNCEIDTCALTSGGQCLGEAPVDCNCDNNQYLTLNISSSGTQRQCVSKCRNGGVLNDARSACICPYPYFGDLCQYQAQCPYQFTGVYCNISLCQNGGTPLPLPTAGCTCSDFYYQGPLCEEDTCGSSIATYRTENGTCACTAGFSGPQCSVSNCGVGGQWVPALGACVCTTGYILAPNNTACLINPLISQECDNGVYESLSTGGFVCSCNDGWSGLTCNITSCVAPKIPVFEYPDGTVVCACPPSLAGNLCQQSTCTQHATGTYVDPVLNATFCQCVEGYASGYEISNGAFQCTLPLFSCSIIGTKTYDYNAGPGKQCICNEGYYGTSCTLFDTAEPSSSNNRIDTPGRLSVIACALFLYGSIIAAYLIYRQKLLQMFSRSK